jgi:hypothetical protein
MVTASWLYSTNGQTFMWVKENSKLVECSYACTTLAAWTCAHNDSNIVTTYKIGGYRISFERITASLATAGMDSSWLHPWCYDANGQPFVWVTEKWMRVRRPPGTKLQIEFVDGDSSWKNGRLYSMRLPKGWPLEEVCCTFPEYVIPLATQESLHVL